MRRLAPFALTCILLALLAGPGCMPEGTGPAAATSPPTVLQAVAGEAARPYQPEKVTFAVQFKDDVIPYRVFGVYVMPGEEVEIEAVFTQGKGTAALAATAGEATEVGAETWHWRAPREPGVYPLRITDTRADEAITLHAFVMVPHDPGQETLAGYRIGTYPAEPYRDNAVYQRPEGFVKVTEENQNVLIAPHFRLGQFTSKQSTDFPKYVVLRERLLLKLEMLLEEVNDRGLDAPTFHVMSAYRTPFYNRSIGNRTSHSVHLYGGAADIFIDADGDTYMDDLDGDGEATVAEARLLAEIVEDLQDETWYRPLIGGLGVYSPAPHRGPFIHVDVRGEPTRW